MTVCFVAGRVDPRRGRPLIVAANRDEFYDRQGLPPRFEPSEEVAYVAPRDPRAGGTWFGLNESGIVVALTNRPAENPLPEAPSRGNLVRDLLGSVGSLSEVRGRVDDRKPGRFNPFVLLVLGPGGIQGLVHTPSEEDRWFGHERGHFFLSNRTGFDYFEQDGEGRFPWSREESASTGALAARLRDFCRRHDGLLGRPYLCGHGEEAGTLSSSVVVLDRSVGALLFDFAQGPPCEVPYRPVAPPVDFRRSVTDAWTPAAGRAHASPEGEVSSRT